MPRNGSGTYTLPAGNPVEPNTIIEAEWANTTLDDIGNEITDSLSRTGEGGMLAPLRFYAGTAGVPGIAWLDETSSGFYRSGAGEFWATVLGTEVVQFTNNGVLIPAGIDLSVEGNVDFLGTFDVLGDFKVNTDKFIVTGASGNTTIAGTLGVTGAITATGGVSGAVTSSSVTITGGTINGTSVGATTASSGAFTSLSASGAFSLTGDQVQISEGGTGATTAAGARTAILPSYSTNALKFLRVNSGATDVEWANEPSLGTVTSVDVSGGSTGLTSSGGPVTTSGTITLAGTVNATHGGTNQTTWTTGDILYASASNTLSKLSIGTNNQILKVSSGIPAWATDTGTGTVTSIDVSGGTTGLTASGGPVTTSGTITLAGTLNVGNGGTGATTLTGIVKGNGTSAFTAATAGTDYVAPGGALGTPSSGTLTNCTSLPLSTGVSGTLAATNGGTAQSTWTTGDILYASATNTLSKLSVGTTGQILKVSGGVPTWATDTSAGTVTSIDVSGGTTGLTTSGGPVTSSGTITLAGTLAVANGGTGQTSYTDGQLLIGNSTGNTLAKSTLTAGSGISITNGSGTITIASTAGGGSVTSVAQSFTGGLISVSGSPITTSGTLALTVAGTSGGIPYFSSASTWASSAALTQYGVMYGGGAGASPSATANGTTGQVLTATTGSAPTWQTPAVVPAGAIIYTANNFGGF